MQQDAYITADAPASHLTAEQAVALITTNGRRANLGANRLYASAWSDKGWIHRTFAVTHDGLYRAAPIRSWLEGVT